MLAVLYGSAFVAAFNENTINVALISIMGEFAVDANTAQWLVTGYMIVTAIVVTVSAFLTKRLRLRTLFLTAAGFLTLGLVAAMLAPTWPLFLAARLVQAVGTGIFIPVMMSTVLAVAPRTRMGTYLSIGGCMITFGPAFAPVVSGLMVTTLGWRSIFLPPAALIVVLAFLGVALIRNIAEPEKIKLDGISVVLSAVGLTSFAFGLSLVMASPAVAAAAIALGLVVMGVFVMRQGRIPNPLLNLEPMCNRLFAPMCALVVVAMMTTFSMSMLLPLYFEGALGTTALAAGALLLAPHPGECRYVPGRRPHYGQAGQLALAARRVRRHHRGAVGSVPLRPRSLACRRAGCFGYRVRRRGPRTLPLPNGRVADAFSRAESARGDHSEYVYPDCRRRGAIAVHRRAVLRGRLGRGRGHRCRPRPGGGFLGGRCCSVRHRGRGHVDRACLMPTSANVSPRSKRLARRRRKQRAVVALQERRLP